VGYAKARVTATSKTKEQAFYSGARMYPNVRLVTSRRDL
jgi:hypothetical protein